MAVAADVEVRDPRLRRQSVVEEAILGTEVEVDRPKRLGRGRGSLHSAPLSYGGADDDGDDEDDDDDERQAQN